MTSQATSELFILNYLNNKRFPTTVEILNAIPNLGVETYVVLDHLIRFGYVRRDGLCSSCQITNAGKLYRASLADQNSKEVKSEKESLRQKYLRPLDGQGWVLFQIFLELLQIIFGLL